MSSEPINEAQFAEAVMDLGRQTVVDAKIAVLRAKHPKTRVFAEQLRRAQMASNTRLLTLRHGKIPITIGKVPAQREAVPNARTPAQTLNGPDFDERFLTAQLERQKALLALYQARANLDVASDLGQFATEAAVAAEATIKEIEKLRKRR